MKQSGEWSLAVGSSRVDELERGGADGSDGVGNEENADMNVDGIAGNSQMKGTNGL